MDIEVAPIANSSASAKPAIPLLGVSIFALPDAYQKGTSTALLGEHVTAKAWTQVCILQRALSDQASNGLIEAGWPAGGERAGCQYKFARVRRFD
jgi:hypothetical protein